MAATAAKKDELTKAWNDLAASLPQTVASIQAKIEELGKAKKLPKGMDKAKLAQAQEGLAGITKSWDEASAAFTAGNLGEALGKASTLKEKGAEVMALLGMAPRRRSGRSPGRRSREVTTLLPSTRPVVALHGPGSSGAVAFLGPERRGDEEKDQRRQRDEETVDRGDREPRQAISSCRSSRGWEGCPTAAPPRARPASAPLRGPPGRARTPRFARCTRALA